MFRKFIRGIVEQVLSFVRKEPTTGLIPNTEQRARLADAAALLGRGRGVPITPEQAVRQPRGPVIVNPESMDDILSAMRK